MGDKPSAENDTRENDDGGSGNERTDDQSLDEGTEEKTEVESEVAVQRSGHGAVQSDTVGASGPTDSRGSADGTGGYVAYDAGPDSQSLADRYGIEVGRRDVQKLQRLEAEFGQGRVQRWAEEGIPVEAMGKPRDMKAFRQQEEASSEDSVQPTPEEGSPEVSTGREAGQESEQVAATEPETERETAETEVNRSTDEAELGTGGEETTVTDAETSAGEADQETGTDADVDRASVEVDQGAGATADVDTGSGEADIAGPEDSAGESVAVGGSDDSPPDEEGEDGTVSVGRRVLQSDDSDQPTAEVGDDSDADGPRPGDSSGTDSELSRREALRSEEALYSNGPLQAKLEVSSPDDPAEKEAERVADEVVRMDAPEADTDERDEESAEEGRTRDDNDLGLIRTVPVSRMGSTSVSGDSEAAVQQGVQGDGKPLPAQTRSEFEAKMGADFSDVSVHTNSTADEGARSINAEAYTMGSDIAFAKGNYSPDSREGRKLLAHELTHTVQQGGAKRKKTVHRNGGSSSESGGSGGGGGNAGIVERLREKLDTGWFSSADPQEIMSLIADTSSGERKKLEAEITNNEQFKNELASALTHEQMMTVLGPGYIDASAKVKLETAMDGWNADEQRVFNIIKNASKEESRAILKDKQVMADLRSTFSRGMMIKALKQLDASVVRKLKVAMSGWNADENQVLSIVTNAPKSEYQTLLNNKQVLADLRNTLSAGMMVKTLRDIESAYGGWGNMPGGDLKSLFENARPDTLKILVNKDPSLLKRISEALPPEFNYTFIDKAWDNTSGRSFDKTKLLFELRFRVTLGADTKKARSWVSGGGRQQTSSGEAYEPSAQGIKDIYQGMRQIPGHLLKSTGYTEIMAFRKPGEDIDGDPSWDTVVEGTATASAGFIRLNAHSHAGGSGDLSETAIHETAHVLDQGDKYSKKGAGLWSVSDWKKHSKSNVVSKIKNELSTVHPSAYSSDEKAVLDKAAKEAAKNKDAKSMSEMESHVITAYKSVTGKSESEARTFFNNNIDSGSPGDPLLRTIAAGHPENSPWFYGRGASPEFHNSVGRVFQMPYKGDPWMSYNRARHPTFGGGGSTMPSKYASRGPGEEFAEIFTAWHTSNNPVSNYGEYENFMKTNKLVDKSLLTG